MNSGETRRHPVVSSDTPDSAITEATTPISNLKSPMPLDFVKGAWKKYSQAHLMTGGDESIFYATHFSNYIRTAVAMPLKAMSAT